MHDTPAEPGIHVAKLFLNLNGNNFHPNGPPTSRHTVPHTWVLKCLWCEFYARERHACFLEFTVCKIIEIEVANSSCAAAGPHGIRPHAGPYFVSYSFRTRTRAEVKVLTTLQQRGQNHHIKAIPKSSNNTKITMMAAIPLDCGRKNKQKKRKV